MKRIEKIYSRPEAGAEIAEAYGKILGAWPKGTERRTFPTNLDATAVISAGDPAAPPLLLLHGSASNSAMWTEDVALFARSHRVHAIDIPGEPGFSGPARGEAGGADYVEWLDAVADALGIGRFSVCGCSLGSYFAIRHAVAKPGRVERMALLCPSGLAPVRASFFAKAAFAKLTGRRGSESLLRSLYAPKDVPAGAMEFGLFMAERFIPRMDPLPLFTDAELSRLAMPILYIGGAHDCVLRSEESASRLGRFASRAELLVDPKAGHALYGYGERISAFLAKP